VPLTRIVSRYSAVPECLLTAMLYGRGIVQVRRHPITRGWRECVVATCCLSRSVTFRERVYCSAACVPGVYPPAPLQNTILPTATVKVEGEGRTSPIHRFVLHTVIRTHRFTVLSALELSKEDWRIRGGGKSPLPAPPSTPPQSSPPAQMTVVVWGGWG
jgi:hypothetical protein